MPVTEVGFNSEVLSLVLDHTRIEKAINTLEAAKLITSGPGAYSRRTLRLDPEKQLCVAQILDSPLTWRLQALKLVCHTFPMHTFVEPL